MASEETSDWLYCALIGLGPIAFSRPSYSIGQFELTKNDEPHIDCAMLLAKSAADWGEVFKPGDWRIKTFFKDCTESDVKRDGRLFAKEALALFNTGHFSLRQLRLRRAGYLVNLKSMNAIPILRPIREKFAETMGAGAYLDEIATHPIAVINSLLSTDPATYGVLGEAIRRSTHWTTASAQMEDYGEIMLMQWMACETLASIDESDTIAPKLLAAVGLPTSLYLMSLPEPERKALLAVPNYRTWTRRLIKLLDELREARNEVVHTGFRQLEIQGKFAPTDLMILRRILPRIAGSVVHLALNALHLQHKTKPSMWADYSRCILLGRSTPLATQASGTTLYQLNEKNSDLYRDE